MSSLLLNEVGVVERLVILPFAYQLWFSFVKDVNLKTVNVVMIGALARSLDMKFVKTKKEDGNTLLTYVKTKGNK